MTGLSVLVMYSSHLNTHNLPVYSGELFWHFEADSVLHEPGHHSSDILHATFCTMETLWEFAQCLRGGNMLTSTYIGLRLGSAFVLSPVMWDRMGKCLLTFVPGENVQGLHFFT